MGQSAVDGRVGLGDQSPSFLSFSRPFSSGPVPTRRRLFRACALGCESIPLPLVMCAEKAHTTQPPDGSGC